MTHGWDGEYAQIDLRTDVVAPPTEEMWEAMRTRTSWAGDRLSGITLLAGSLLFVAAAFVLVNVLVDLLYTDGFAGALPAIHWER